MGKDKGLPEGRESNKPLTPDTAASTESRSSRLKRKRRDKRMRWLKGVGTGVLVSVLGGIIVPEFPGMVHAAHSWLSPPPPPKSALPPRAGKSHGPSTPSSGGGVPSGQNQTPICSLQMVSERPLDSWKVHAWTFPTGFTPKAYQIAQINEAGNNADLINRYLYDDGGYAPFTYTRLILQNSCSKSMKVIDIQALKSCQAGPLDGTIFVGQPKLSEPSSANEGTGAGSEVDSTQIGINLDSSDPEAMLASGWNVSRWTQQYAAGSLATIPDDGGTYAFDIRTIALHMACSFRIQVTYLYNEKIHTKIFDDDGQPFRVSALLPGVLKSRKPGSHPYAGYGILYIGWSASPWPDGTWERENPKTWQLSRPKCQGCARTLSKSAAMCPAMSTTVRDLHVAVKALRAGRR